MQIYSKSDVGLKRPSNQDNFAYGQDNNAVWVVVCDGMGGSNGGDVASGIAVNAVKRVIASKKEKNIDRENIKDVLIEIVNKANDEIFSASKQNGNLKGMGTTMVLGIVLEDKVHVVHVGDSRAYLLHKDTIEQLTIDHSMVQQMVDNGEITSKEAREHPKKNIITRAVGVQDFVVADYICKDFCDGDTLLMCTDGLTNYIDDNKLLYLCRNYQGETLVNKLIDTANGCGGSDNITVVVIKK